MNVCGEMVETETEVLNGNSVVVPSVYHKSYMERPGIEPGLSP